MTSINRSFHLTSPVAHTAEEPLLDVASTSAQHTVTIEEAVPELTLAHPSTSGGRMRMLLNGMARGTSATYHGAIEVGRAGYNNIVKPAGLAAIYSSAMAAKYLATFAQESVTGVTYVEGHPVSGRADSTLSLMQQMIPLPTDFFAQSESGISEKGRAFLKNVADFAGGLSSTFLYQMMIVGAADTVGRVCAQATWDELKEGNLALPLAVTGAATFLGSIQTAKLLKSMNYLSNLEAYQKSVVIAAHHGITPEEFDAKSDTEKEALEAKTKRDWVILSTGAMLMPAAASAMCMMANLFPAHTLASPLFMSIAENVIKVAVRSPVYGGMREALQEIFSGQKGGGSDMTHTEACRSAIKYAATSGAVNIGQKAAKKATMNYFHASSTDWKVLTALALVNAIGESVNWADTSLDRTNKHNMLAEVARNKLKEEHSAKGLPPPTPEQLDEVGKLAKFAFKLGFKDQSFAQAFRNIERRFGGSLFAREGVYACANAISNIVSTLESTVEGSAVDKDTYDVLNNLVLGLCTCFTSIKFNACGQSMGALRGLRAHNESKTEESSSSASIDSAESIDSAVPTDSAELTDFAESSDSAVPAGFSPMVWKAFMAKEGSSRGGLSISRSKSDLVSLGNNTLPLLPESERPNIMFSSVVDVPGRSSVRRRDFREEMSDYN